MPKANRPITKCYQKDPPGYYTRTGARITKFLQERNRTDTTEEVQEDPQVEEEVKEPEPEVVGSQHHPLDNLPVEDIEIPEYSNIKKEEDFYPDFKVGGQDEPEEQKEEESEEEPVPDPSQSLSSLPFSQFVTVPDPAPDTAGSGVPILYYPAKKVKPDPQVIEELKEHTTKKWDDSDYCWDV